MTHDRLTTPHRLKTPRQDLLFEPGADSPLVWLELSFRCGTACDPVGTEGFIRHVGELASRGAGKYDRMELDEQFDAIGASLDIHSDRDTTVLSGMCLSRHIDRFIELVILIITSSRMDPSEHDKLIRETRASLDELRDDDNAIATRFFQRYYYPGHPYARTSVGTSDSLNRITVSESIKAWPHMVTADTVTIGLAGDITTAAAEQISENIHAALPTHARYPSPDLNQAKPPQGKHLYLIQKAKTQPDTTRDWPPCPCLRIG